MGGIGITSVICNRPRQQLSLGIELDSTARNFRLIDRRDHGKRLMLLPRQG